MDVETMGLFGSPPKSPRRRVGRGRIGQQGLFPLMRRRRIGQQGPCRRVGELMLGDGLCWLRGDKWMQVNWRLEECAKGSRCSHCQWSGLLTIGVSNFCMLKAQLVLGLRLLFLPEWHSGCRGHRRVLRHPLFSCPFDAPGTMDAWSYFVVRPGQLDLPAPFRRLQHSAALPGPCLPRKSSSCHMRSFFLLRCCRTTASCFLRRDTHAAACSDHVADTPPLDLRAAPPIPPLSISQSVSLAHDLHLWQRMIWASGASGQALAASCATRSSATLRPFCRSNRATRRPGVAAPAFEPINFLYTIMECGEQKIEPLVPRLLRLGLCACVHIPHGGASDVSRSPANFHPVVVLLPPGSITRRHEDCHKGPWLWQCRRRPNSCRRSTCGTIVFPKRFCLDEP